MLKKSIVDLLQTATNLSDLLLGNELGITICQGWPSWLWILLGNNILPISVASLLLKFQLVTPPSLYHCGLNKRHSFRGPFIRAEPRA